VQLNTEAPLLALLSRLVSLLVLLLLLLPLLALPLSSALLLLFLQPFEFTAGEPVTVTFKKAGDSAGGLFAGGSGPKPPPALSTAVIGMKQGGRVRHSFACRSLLLLLAYFVC
jgi:hypothetical protein